MVPRS